ncbi:MULTISPECIES: ABC transporter ATP-binding protein [Paenibacillus]|uniref:ATP-binding cassette subfamily B protein AbcA/BmrA n=1 Tax=Paenibacillus pabuli TaxID=1472 RepID=A0A855Y0G6_9BACL|nr:MULTISPECIES: ABC transporter ATP-binding protein [Paenibacillus]PWW32689.1 ATP-binding cassette subfamily B protein AbcA/BmrA [Paenibacillus pabuli]PXV98362.1 ATP-binding cassette subfamily B protein AbcA/BmrA [Paenibacillus taichungensis]
MRNQASVQPNARMILDTDQDQKVGIWKPFFKLIATVRLPYWWIALCIVATLSQSSVALLFPQYVQKILAGDISQGTIWITIALLFGIGITVSLVQFVASVTSAKISLKFRKLIWKHLIHLPIPYYDVNMPREMISRTTDDTTKLSDLFARDLANAISSIYLLIGTLVILFSYDWRLAVVEALIIPLIIALGIINGRLSFKWTNRIQAGLAQLTEFLSELLLNIPLIKTFTKENREENRGKELIDKLYITRLMYEVITKTLLLMNELISVLQTIIVIVLGIYLVSEDIITLPIWIAFYLYAQGLTGSVSVVMSAWTNLKTCQGAARRITEISIEPTEPYDTASHSKKINDDLLFENVTFKYAENNILTNVSFTIPHGKVTAIIGPSGAGKSTIFNLVERFYKPNTGEIKMGDRSIDHYNLQEWRKSIGCVSQETKLFSGTIRENITYGIDREIQEDEIIRAAKDASAWEFITSFDNGLDTEVGEIGSKLSGGQRQRIAIARVILKDPEYVLLDEATSSLDAEAGYLVDQALKKLSIGRTTIIIAHQLSTIESADQIIMLSDEQVSGIGNHRSLLESNAVYKRMIDIQQSL